ncbi:MAG TPA: 5-oxoprolinase subunit PxpB [Candidatus Limnocylindria bacterium]
MIRPFGEAALLVEVGDPERAQAVAAALASDRIAGIAELVPGLESVLIDLDPGADPALVASTVQERLEYATPHRVTGRRRTIPVVYGGDHGPDLEEVASLCGMAPAELAERHSALEQRVLFDGFAPGFAYLGTLPPELRVSRLATPRTRTPAGSVAVADAMSGIYPAELPGGWRVIGRTPVPLFDPRRDPPAYLVAGDIVRFEAISAADWDARAIASEDWG